MRTPVRSNKVMVQTHTRHLSNPKKRAESEEFIPLEIVEAVCFTLHHGPQANSSIRHCQKVGIDGGSLEGLTLLNSNV